MKYRVGASIGGKTPKASAAKSQKLAARPQALCRVLSRRCGTERWSGPNSDWTIAQCHHHGNTQWWRIIFLFMHHQIIWMLHAVSPPLTLGISIPMFPWVPCDPCLTYTWRCTSSCSSSPLWPPAFCGFFYNFPGFSLGFCLLFNLTQYYSWRCNESWRLFPIAG